MQKMLSLTLLLLLYHASQAQTNTSESDSAAAERLINDDSLNELTGTYYVVIADTGTDYYTLQHTMFKLSRQLGIGIDTMGRSYNAQKDLIALPENDPDEMYAGEYYPRREPSEFLSLEYYNFYLGTESGNSNMALVAGIYSSAEKADKLKKRLETSAPKAFVLKAYIYIGCMH